MLALKTMILRLTLLFGCLSVPMLSFANQTPPQYPWHLVNLWWDCVIDKDATFQSLKYRMKISGKTSKGDFLYIAPVGHAKIGGVQIYAGIQTDVYGWRSLSDRQTINHGRGGIFSRWALPGEKLSPEFLSGERLSFYEVASYEGHFASVRHPHNWAEGEYEFELTALPRTQKQESWVEASITDLSTQEKTVIGRINFSGKTLTFEPGFASFVEVYGGDKKRIPEVTVSFQQPLLNGKSCGSSTVYVVVPKNNQPVGIRYSQTSIDGSWVSTKIFSERQDPYVTDFRLRIPAK